MQLFTEQAIEIRCCCFWPWHWNESENCEYFYASKPTCLHSLKCEKKARNENRLNHMWNLNTQFLFFNCLPPHFQFWKTEKDEKEFIFASCNLQSTDEARYVTKVHKFIYTLDTCCHSHCAIKSICTITLHIACKLFSSIKTEHTSSRSSVQFSCLMRQKRIMQNKRFVLYRDAFLCACT